MEKVKARLDDYEVLRTLGVGGNAKVKLVRNTDNKLYAAKIMQPTS